MREEYAASTVIKAQRRVLQMCLGLIWAHARSVKGVKRGKELDVLLTDGKSLITAGEAINHITQALQLKVKR